MDYTVVLPDIEDLRNFELTPRSVNEIEQAALWTLNESSYLKEWDKLYLFGISFAGGLCVSAAARDALTDRIAGVFSFGGHGILDETLKYLISGKLPDGTKLKPHVYGQAVVARTFASQMVPAEQVATLRSVLLDYLIGKNSQVKKQLDTLPKETGIIVDHCLKYNGDELGALLQERVTDYSMDVSLSPARGQTPQIPLYFLHGATDNVIPPSESKRLYDWSYKYADSTLLVTPLIKHVDIDDKTSLENVSWFEYYKLVRFWTELLRD